MGGRHSWCELHNSWSIFCRFRKTHSNICPYGGKQHQTKYCRPILVVVQPFRTARTKPGGPEDEQNSRVCDSDKSCECEYGGTDQTTGICWGHEVEKGRSNHTDEDSEVQPFLWGISKMSRASYSKQGTHKERPFSGEVNLGLDAHRNGDHFASWSFEMSD